MISRINGLSKLQDYVEIIVFLLISFGALVGTYLNAQSELFGPELMYILVVVFLVILLETIISILLEKFWNRTAKILFLTAASIFNIYCLRLIFVTDFIGLSTFTSTLFLMVGAFIVFTLLSFAIENKRNAIISIFLGLFFVLINVAAESSSIPIFKTNNQQIPSASVLGTSLPKFEKKPNVYVVSFDSLTPRPLVKKHFQLEGVAYNDFLENNFRVFPNLFADAVPTKASLNSFLALNYQYYFEDIKKLWGSQFNDSLYTGVIPSPLFQIFKYNGYTTNTLFNSYFFGHKVGRHVDNYHVNSTNKITACQFIDQTIERLAFFGACKFYKKQYLTFLLSKKADHKDGKKRKISSEDFLISKMREGKKVNTPQIFLAYIYHPGHTPKAFNHNNKKQLSEYVEQHNKKSSRTRQIMAQLLTFIKEEDPNAILMIFGDHGAWLSRVEKIKSTKSKTFFIQDRYAVLGGIYPRSACMSQTEKTQTYFTLQFLANKLIHCLSGNKNAMKPPNPGPGRLAEHNILFKDYLYE